MAIVAVALLRYKTSSSSHGNTTEKPGQHLGESKFSNQIDSKFTAVSSPETEKFAVSAPSRSSLIAFSLLSRSPSAQHLAQSGMWRHAGLNCKMTRAAHGAMPTDPSARARLPS